MIYFVGAHKKVLFHFFDIFLNDEFGLCFQIFEEGVQVFLDFFDVEFDLLCLSEGFDQKHHILPGITLQSAFELQVNIHKFIFGDPGFQSFLENLIEHLFFLILKNLFPTFFIQIIHISQSFV